MAAAAALRRRMYRDLFSYVQGYGRMYRDLVCGIMYRDLLRGVFIYSGLSLSLSLTHIKFFIIIKVDGIV